MNQSSAIILCLVVFIVIGSQLHAQDDKIVLTSPELERFYIGSRPNNAASEWIYDDRTRKLVGYAPWDYIRRRWTLFSLDGQYKGFIQATIGDDGHEFIRRRKEGSSSLTSRGPNPKPPHFTQFLWYDSHNRYKGLFVRLLGGRPATVERPDGELGGQLAVYMRGEIQSVPPPYLPEAHPFRRMMEGVEVNPIDPTISR
jgi:hypothetical protein